MFGYGIDRKVIYIVLGILVVYSLASMSSTALISMLITLPVVILAISFHEFAHANAADKLGDTTPRNQGRLTVNPLKHLDPFGFVLLMFANIGWGKPVEINPNNFTSNKSRGVCEAIVALAGPLMNFFLAIICIIIRVLIFNLNYMFLYSTIGAIIDTFLMCMISINIGLGVFNLIPLPPLDGEKIFKNVLPARARYWLDTNYQTLYIIFMILWITGFLGKVVSPVIYGVSQVLYKIIECIVGIFI